MVSSFFYENRNDITNYAAQVVLKEMTDIFGRFDSVVDYGCGVGTWLKVSQELGASRILGLDLPQAINSRSLLVNKSRVEIIDFEDEIRSHGKFDLAISLEVAEHLSEKSGQNLLNTLTNTAPVILFSAAIPGQIGHGHINLHWPDYWRNCFLKRGYILLDVIRPIIFDDNKIPWWYRQNIFVAVKKEDAYRHITKMMNENQFPLLMPSDLSPQEKEVVYCDKNIESIRQALKILHDLLKKRTRRKIRNLNFLFKKFFLV